MILTEPGPIGYALCLCVHSSLPVPGPVSGPVPVMKPGLVVGTGTLVTGSRCAPRYSGTAKAKAYGKL